MSPIVPHRFLREGNFDAYVEECAKSIEHFREQGKHSPESLMFREVVTVLFDKKRDWDRCIEFCSAWLSRIPPMSETYNGGAYFPSFYCSKSLRMKGDLPEALKYARQAVEASRKLPDKELIVQSTAHHALLLTDQGRLDNAISDIETATNDVKDALSYGHLLTTLGHVYRLKGELGSALESVNEATARLATVKELPRLGAQAYILKAEVLIDLDEPGARDEARKALDTAQLLLKDANSASEEHLESVRARLASLS